MAAASTNAVSVDSRSIARLKASVVPASSRASSHHSAALAKNSLRETPIRRAARSTRGGIDYAVTQYSGSYPLVIAPGTTRLSALVSDCLLWPQVSMRDVPRNQNACKGAVVGLDHAVSAIR